MNIMFDQSFFELMGLCSLVFAFATFATYMAGRQHRKEKKDGRKRSTDEPTTLL